MISKHLDFAKDHSDLHHRSTGGIKTCRFPCVDIFLRSHSIVYVAARKEIIVLVCF